MSASPKILLSISHEMRILDFSDDGEVSSLDVSYSISSSLCLGLGGGGRYGLLNVAKTWNTTRMNIAMTILECLKEKCFLPYFSRTFTAKAKAIMAKKHLRLLPYSWILNQVGPGWKKYHKNNHQQHDRPARMP